MRKKLVRAALIGLALMFAAAPVAWSQDEITAPDYETLNASIMRPDMKTLQRWLLDYRMAPSAYLDPEIERKMPPGGSLSLLSHVQYTPSERQQGNCGNCWNWAGTGVVEVALDVQQATKDRLSTQYLNSCKQDQYACCGGWLTDFASWYQGQGLSVPWSNSNASFADAGSQCGAGQSSVTCGSVGTGTNYPITSIGAVTISTIGVSQATAIANIKNVLNQNKAVWFGFFLPNDSDWNQFFNFWSGTGASETAIWNPDFSCGHAWNQNQAGGHAVLLVGYNDDDANPANHYWIMLNSWGTASGKRPNGLFRMAMNINYSCTFPAGIENVEALTFQTLDITFGGGGSCTYLIDPTDKSFIAAGGSDSITVTTQPGCAWTASESLGWASITSGDSGSGSGTVAYTVDANAGAGSRSGTISVAGKTFTITQAGSGGTLPANMVLNPSFESGRINWKQYSSGGYQLLYNYYPYANTGNWLAWLGGYNNAYEYVYQVLTIPSSATQALLQFSYRVDTEEPSGEWDYLYAGLWNPFIGDWVFRGYLSNANSGASYADTSIIDLTPYKGQKLWLAFVAENDSTYPTNFFIDDVTLGVALPSGQGTLIVENPNNRQNWYRGETRVINWVSLGDVGNVDILLRRRTFYGWKVKTIVSNTPNTGFYYWNVPAFQRASPKYKIRVRATGNNSLFDDSNLFFRIR